MGVQGLNFTNNVTLFEDTEHNKQNETYEIKALKFDFIDFELDSSKIRKYSKLLIKYSKV